MPRDLLILLVALVVAVVGGLLTVRGRSKERPSWPFRLYVALFRRSNLPALKQYGESRTHASTREQFLIAAFIWFFVLFVVGQVFFGCSLRTGQGFMCS
jgi:hypothetical protein